MDATDFAAFYQELRQCRTDTKPEQAREEYLKLPAGERLPEDTDPFSSDQVPGVDDGDWPAWPAQRMLDWVPKEIQKEYGSIESTRLNGEYPTFYPRNEPRIIAAFWRAGYRCVRGDTLNTAGQRPLRPGRGRRRLYRCLHALQSNNKLHYRNA